MPGQRAELQPFLKEGDFERASSGDRPVDALQPADLVVEIAYSASYVSRLEWVLRKWNIHRLLVCGIVRNGGGASTQRHADVRTSKRRSTTTSARALSQRSTTAAGLAERQIHRPGVWMGGLYDPR